MATLEQRIAALEQKPRQSNNALASFLEQLALNQHWLNLDIIRKRNQG
jgi:hypothetical protein